MAHASIALSAAQVSGAPDTVAPAPWDREGDLVSQAKSGSVAATERLIGLYETKVLRITERITKNREDAEEAAQNALFKAFHHLPSFREGSRFYTWLVRIAINEALMMLRRRPIGRVSIDGVGQEDEASVYLQLEDSRPDPEEECSRREMARILGTRLGQMKPGYRIAFKLREVEGLSIREVALALDVSETAAKSRLQRARTQLKKSLAASLRPPKKAHTLRLSAAGPARCQNPLGLSHSRSVRLQGKAPGHR
jgi:RNA polymerase sigma-70 factor (ECF subfamily)